MRSYVFDSLRAALSTLTLDQAFDCKDDISVNLKAALNFSDYGFQICQTLVTDISPNNRVRDAMNEINSSMRIKEASYQRAEGEKLLKVKRAEAEAESMHLSGVGVARSRHAIMDGLKESIQAFSEGVTGTNARDVMDLLILTQYFDALQEVGSRGNVKTIFLSGDSNPMRSAMLEANTAR
ncbi:HIRL2 [Symbiodinium microadriaticum]|nr:HIRL2 [Symbiodinium microadriaticum]